ncbi:MAG: dephospho-CoA kinase [Thermoleophilaceae bacterium]
MAGEDARVPFVGLTGGMAAGKSEALKALERLGAATLSSDDVVRDLLTTGEIRDQLVERFGDEVAPNGEVDRGKVASVVFADPEQREWLEGLLWPRVGQRIVEWREELEKRDPRPRAAVVEVPLLFESGMDGAFDKTIAVVADEAVREERAGARGHEGVASRTARQLPQEEKAQRADFAIRNDGTLDELGEKLSDVLARMGT